ncbi:MAG: type II toxin-antitoxin system RelE/ParE family toxin [Isosphaeraceae bacterium]
MGQVYWAESALDDLKDLLNFVRKDSPAYADRLAASISGATRTLASFPRLGSSEFWDIIPVARLCLRDWPRARQSTVFSGIPVTEVLETRCSDA